MINRKYIAIVFILLSIFFVNKNHAQDSVNVRKQSQISTRIPKKAALWGILPSGGQFYNKRYWKVPLVLGALGGLYYWTEYNRSYYTQFKGYFEDKLLGNPIPSPYDRLTNQQLFNFKQIFRKDLERSYIFLALAYLLSIAEAFTDAHLHSFDISDKISLTTTPSQPYTLGAGIKITLGGK